MEGNRKVIKVLNAELCKVFTGINKCFIGPNLLKN